MSNCAALSSKSVRLCAQDVSVNCNSKAKSDNLIAGVLFDNGSQTILVRDKFAESAGYNYTKALYSVAAPA